LLTNSFARAIAVTGLPAAASARGDARSASLAIRGRSRRCVLQTRCSRACGPRPGWNRRRSRQGGDRRAAG
jgi:hypothetical protein